MSAVDDAEKSTESWGCIVDDCLGKARSILDYATQAFIGGYDVDHESAVALAESWRDLATHWSERQRLEMELAYTADEMFSEDEDEDEPVKVKR